MTTRAEAGVMEQEDLGGQLLESILSRRAPFSLEASWFELFDALRQLGFWRPAAAAETVRIEGNGGGLETEIQRSSLIGLATSIALSSKPDTGRPGANQAGLILLSAVGAPSAMFWGPPQVEAS